MPYLGEISALLTAMCWTASSLSFGVASRAVAVGGVGLLLSAKS